MKNKIPIEKARQIAEAFMDYLKLKYVKRMAIAGSVRRGEQYVGDIEIIIEIQNGYHHIFQSLIKQLIAIGIIEPGPPNKGCINPPLGPRYYRLKYRGVKIDLFVVYPPAQWGIIYTIRTGPAEHSKYLMIRAKKLGYTIKNGQLLKNGKPIPVPDEYTFYKLLGYKKVPPPSQRR